MLNFYFKNIFRIWLIYIPKKSIWESKFNFYKKNIVVIKFGANNLEQPKNIFTQEIKALKLPIPQTQFLRKILIKHSASCPNSKS